MVSLMHSLRRLADSKLHQRKQLSCLRNRIWRSTYSDQASFLRWSSRQTSLFASLSGPARIFRPSTIEWPVYVTRLLVTKRFLQQIRFLIWELQVLNRGRSLKDVKPQKKRLSAQNSMRLEKNQEFVCKRIGGFRSRWKTRQRLSSPIR